LSKTLLSSNAPVKQKVAGAGKIFLANKDDPHGDSGNA
jgi:hypothetical protein